jgi:hypothetical protein
MKNILRQLFYILSQKLTFATTYDKSIAYLYIRDQFNDMLGLNTDQHPTNLEPSRKNTSQWRINLVIQKIVIVLMLVQH